MHPISTSNTALAKQFDAWLGRHFKPSEPGVAVIATRDGKVIFRNGYGMANIELGVPVKPAMVFRLGSLTKQFTAVAILMLMERGKLALEDRITKYIARYPVHGHKITVEHLLNHTSGIKSYTDMPEFWKDAKEDKSVEEQIAFFKDQPMDFKPGQSWHYSNSGYLLLGAIIEKISGQTYETFLQQHIFDKVGMADTHFDLPHKIIPGRVQGYSRNPTTNAVENEAYISMTRPHAAGSLASSVDDLAKWDAALYTERLLSQHALQQAWTPLTLKNGRHTHYGYDWGSVPLEDVTVIEHGGGIHGFATHAMRIPERRLYVAALSNTTNPPLDPGFVASYMALGLIGKPHHEPEPISLGKSALSKFVGRYKVNDWQTITITRMGTSLNVQWQEGRPTQALMAVASNGFALPNTMLRLRFNPSGAGPAHEVQLFDRGALIDTAMRIADSGSKRPVA